MSPLYDFRCPNGHVATKLMRWDGLPMSVTCEECGEHAVRQFPLAHVPPDGVYSHSPNIGDPQDFERKQEDIRQRKERGEYG